jgi:serine/threonine protein phosphatase PrpC
MEADWQVIGAVVQGLSHQKQDLPCQDALEYRCLPGGALLVALADGAGSATRSELGARAAVQAAMDSLASALESSQPAECCAWVDLFWETFEKARAALIQLAEERNEPLWAFATTLTCLAAMPDQLIVGQLGDGAVVARGADGVLDTVTTSQRGEYANETYFLTQEQAMDQVAIQVINLPMQALAVMSDGLTRLALKRPTNEPHLPFFEPLFAFVEASAPSDEGAQANEALAAFLASPRVCERTDDDKALVLALRPGCETGCS